MRSEDAYRKLAMPVASAVYQPTDSRYPVAIMFPGDFVKLSRDEAINLVGELLDVVNRIDQELKEAA